jgi:small ligand-binding sensory domain FIST
MAEIKERPKGSGNWLVRVFLGRDPRTGKIRYHNRTIHGTKDDAVDYALDAELKHRRGKTISSRQPNLVNI